MTKPCRQLAVWAYLVLCLGGLSRGAITPADKAILTQVATEYRLTPEQTRLLLAIRRIENGGPGREMGVLRPEAQRYRGNHAKSLRLQAQWAAGTVAQRYRSAADLESFARRWAPVGCTNDPSGLNRNWLALARSTLAR